MLVSEYSNNSFVASSIHAINACLIEFITNNYFANSELVRILGGKRSGNQSNFKTLKILKKSMSQVMVCRKFASIRIKFVDFCNYHADAWDFRSLANFNLSLIKCVRLLAFFGTPMN
jgi:hypothetical protein